MRRISILWLLALLLIVDIQLSVGEPKRSFGLSGRSRAKSNSNLSVRRRTHVEPPKAPPQPSAPKQSHASHVASAPQQPVGPPPAYSAGPSVGKTSLNAAPPAYSSHAAPPSYSAATGLNSHANYPRQGYSGVNSGTNLHQSAPPSYGSSPYNNHYGGNAHYGGNNHYGGGFAQPPSPGFGGYPSGGFGSYGGGHNGGMMGSGMGMMGGGMGMMGGGGMQPVYVQQKSSMLPGIAGGVISGLAAYQLSRAIGGMTGGGGYGSYGNHHSTQHVYHHYDNQGNPQSPQSPQTSAAAPQQNLQSTSNVNAQNVQTPYAHSVPAVPLAPFPNDGSAPVTSSVPLAPFPNEPTATESQSQSNAAGEPNVTPVPEFDSEFPFSTIHPSLFPYASPMQYSRDLEYWAKSVNKKLNLTTPDTANSSSQSTTVTP